ncbi:PQQ-dependent catabolism-associated CXXCW motif protein [Methylocystis sp. 9N]|uniref:PQQ-dependent catabolism-associated CXXCW motif protein n=1 Tax=Methylocystis borbori TaxID=3118750 RepID=A0ABU7XHR1_9HYPH
MNFRIFGFVALALLAAFPAAATESPPPEPESYRLDNYHAPTPLTLKGARVLDTPQAYELWSGKQAAFIDALARPPKPEGLPKNAVWRDPKRFDIPGSIWLPDTGFGELSESAARYFEQGLARASGGDKSKLLVFYCRTNCWASWNAAKRAMSLGYTNIAWYPPGADGWEQAGHPLEEREPEPRE